MSETTYRFAPHPTGGFLLGLRIPQLLGFVITGALALGALRLGGLAGVALTLGLALASFPNHTSEERNPVSYGLADDTVQAFSPFDKNLAAGPMHVKKARLVIPYDVLFKHVRERETTAQHERERLNKEPEETKYELLTHWVAAVQKEHISEILITVGRDESCPHGNKECELPGLEEYRAGFKDIMQWANARGIKTFGAWNEPDLPSDPTWGHAKLAAQYWQVAQYVITHNHCGDCTRAMSPTGPPMVGARCNAWQGVSWLTRKQCFTSVRKEEAGLKVSNLLKRLGVLTDAAASTCSGRRIPGANAWVRAAASRFEHPVLAGPFAAFDYGRVGPEDHPFSEDVIRVVDLDNGRRVHDVPTGPSPKPEWGIGVGPATAIVLKSDGSVAWIAEKADRLPTAPPEYEVRAVGRNGERLLASGTSVNPTSLALAGNTLYWTEAGRRMSAPLN